LEGLVGAWTLRRDIQPEGAFLHGEAVFVPDGEGALAYRESGVLTLADGGEFSAYREYLYRVSGDSVLVEFADGPDVGKRFVRMKFLPADRGLQASDIHLCGGDTYQVTYRILGPATFEVSIKVRGPAKAYELVSRYSRSLPDVAMASSGPGE
jgi:hypothetical protein